MGSLLFFLVVSCCWLGLLRLIQTNRCTLAELKVGSWLLFGHSIYEVTRSQHCQAGGRLWVELDCRWIFGRRRYDQLVLRHDQTTDRLYVLEEALPLLVDDLSQHLAYIVIEEAMSWPRQVMFMNGQTYTRDYGGEVIIFETEELAELSNWQTLVLKSLTAPMVEVYEQKTEPDGSVWQRQYHMFEMPWSPTQCYLVLRR